MTISKTVKAPAKTTATKPPKATRTTAGHGKATTAKADSSKAVAASLKESRNLNIATVPEISIYNSYVSRMIGSRSDFEILDYASAEHINVLIEGPTGPGKTMAAMAYAAFNDKAFYSVSSNVGIEPSQLFGKYIPDGAGGFEWIDGPVTTLVRNGGVLLLNEVNFMPERVATVLFGLLDSRREIVLLDHKAEVIKAHDDLLVLADMNPDYEGTRTLNKAFRNRFAIQLFWDYDEAVEAKLIKSEELRKAIAMFRRQFKEDVLTTPVSTNMGMEFERIERGLGLDFAIRNFTTHFASDERESVARAFEAVSKKLSDDFAKINNTKVYTQEELDEMRQNAKPGYVDPEWGVYGTGPNMWCWDEDAEEVDELEQV